MVDLILLVAVAAGYLSAYVVSLYSLAVYIDPDEVENLYPDVSSSRQRFLKKLAGDPRAFVQMAVVYKSFALVAMTVLTAELLTRHPLGDTVPALAARVAIILLLWLLYILWVEYMPRRASRQAINPQMMRHLWIIAIIYYLFFPVVRSYRLALSRIGQKARVTEEDKDEIVERAIETLAEQAGIGETIVEQDEKEMIEQIFQLDQTVVREIMLPRVDIIGIDKSMSFKDIRALVVRDGHSRYPVFDGSIDKILGLIYVKDLFNRQPEPGEKFVIGDYLREPYFVPETKVIGELLREFKTKHMHIAVVVDEYGGVAGLVTLEDIIEEIFGEIQDEHDWEEAEIVKMSDGGYMVSANLLVEELQDKLDTDYEQGDYDTVGGLIYDLVGSVPREGQIVKWHELDFEIDKVEGQRIMTVKVRN